MLYDYKSGLGAKQSSERISKAFPGDHASYSTVTYWFRRFKTGDESLDDDDKSGRPTTSGCSDNVDAIRRLLDEDPRTSYISINSVLSIGNSTIQKIIHDDLKMSKIECRFVPHHLSTDQKLRRVSVCQEWLKIFGDESSTALSGLVTGDETILRQYEPLDKRSSAVWCCEDEVPTSQVTGKKWTKRAMVCTFFMRSGHLITIPVPPKQTVTANWYSTVALPQVLRAFDAIRKNRVHFRLHHDNAPAHSARLTQDFLHESGVRVLSHPPYSPDLAPADFFLFGATKANLRGKEFGSLNEVLEAFNEAVASIPKETWRNCFKEWFRRMRLCIETHGEYIE